MKSKSIYLAGLTGLGILAALASACGDSGTGTGGAGTSASNASATSGTKGTTTGKGVTSTVTGGGGMGDGNDSFAQAVALPLGGSGVNGIDDVPGTDADFYKFTATAGPIIISAASLPANTQNDQTFIDMYIEVYDSNQVLIASNDDRYPHPPGNTDSEILTTLAAGDYFVKVMDFCSSPIADPNQCGATQLAMLTQNQYTLFAAEIVPDMGDVAEGAEPNETQATATLLTHAATTPAGSYFLTTAWGTFAADTDVDWYKINIPADTTHDVNAQTTTTISPPWGTANQGNGSAAEIGLVEVIDPLDPVPTNAIASFDFTNEPRTAGRTDITVPLVASDSGFYFLKVHHGANVTPGSGQFYFIFQGVGGDNPLEQAEVTNSVPSSPEVLALLPQQTAYFVAGNLPAADVDYFKVAALSGKPKLVVACSSARSGSGVLGLTATVYKADGTTPIASGTATETLTADLVIPPATSTMALDLGGETNPVIKISSTGQKAGVTGTYYRCGFGFSAM